SALLNASTQASTVTTWVRADPPRATVSRSRAALPPERAARPAYWAVPRSRPRVRFGNPETRSASWPGTSRAYGEPSPPRQAPVARERCTDRPVALDRIPVSCSVTAPAFRRLQPEV